MPGTNGAARSASKLAFARTEKQTLNATERSTGHAHLSLIGWPRVRHINAQQHFPQAMMPQ